MSRCKPAATLRRCSVLACALQKIWPCCCKCFGAPRLLRRAVGPGCPASGVRFQTTKGNRDRMKLPWPVGGGGVSRRTPTIRGAGPAQRPSIVTRSALVSCTSMRSRCHKRRPRGHSGKRPKSPVQPLWAGLLCTCVGSVTSQAQAAHDRKDAVCGLSRPPRLSGEIPEGHRDRCASFDVTAPAPTWIRVPVVRLHARTASARLDPRKPLVDDCREPRRR